MKHLGVLAIVIAFSLACAVESQAQELQPPPVPTNTPPTPGSTDIPTPAQSTIQQPTSAPLPTPAQSRPLPPRLKRIRERVVVPGTQVVPPGSQSSTVIKETTPTAPTTQVLPAASTTPPQAEMATHPQEQVKGTGPVNQNRTIVDEGGNLKVVPKNVPPPPKAEETTTTTVKKTTTTPDTGTQSTTTTTSTSNEGT